MRSSWYRRKVPTLSGNRNFVYYTYRNSANFPLIRQIQVEYIKSKEKFLILLYPSSITSQQKLLECYKEMLSDEELRKNVYLYDSVEIIISIKAMVPGSDLLEKMLKIFQLI